MPYQSLGTLLLYKTQFYPDKNGKWVSFDGELKAKLADMMITYRELMGKAAVEKGIKGVVRDEAIQCLVECLLHEETWGSGENLGLNDTTDKNTYAVIIPSFEQLMDENYDLSVMAANRYAAPDYACALSSPRLYAEEMMEGAKLQGYEVTDDEFPEEDLSDATKELYSRFYTKVIKKKEGDTSLGSADGHESPRSSNETTSFEDFLKGDSDSDSGSASGSWSSGTNHQNEEEVVYDDPTVKPKQFRGEISAECEVNLAREEEPADEKSEDTKDTATSEADKSEKSAGKVVSKHDESDNSDNERAAEFEAFRDRCREELIAQIRYNLDVLDSKTFVRWLIAEFRDDWEV